MAIAVVMGLSSVLVALSGVAAATPSLPTPTITLSPGSVLNESGSQLEVTGMTSSFSPGVPLYYQISCNGTWYGTGSTWFRLPAGNTTIPLYTLTPNLGGAGALCPSSFYLLVSATSNGLPDTGVESSQLISIVQTAPSFSLSQYSGAPGTTVTVTGSGFGAGDSADVYLFTLGAPGFGVIGYNPSDPIAVGTATSSGGLTTTFVVPPLPTGTYAISVIDQGPSLSPTSYAYNLEPEWYAGFTVGPSLAVPTSAVLAETGFASPATISIAGAGFPAGATVTVTDNYINASGSLATSPSPLIVGPAGSFSAKVSIAGATYASSRADGGPTLLTATTGAESASGTLTLATPTVSLSPGGIVPGANFTATGTGFGIGVVVGLDSVVIGSDSGATNVQTTASSSGTFSMLIHTGPMVTFPALGDETVSITATNTVVVGGSLTQTVGPKIDLLAPQITVTSPIGPGQTGTVSGTDFYVGSVVDADSLAIDGATITNNQIVVSPTNTIPSTPFTATPVAGTLWSGWHTFKLYAQLPHPITIGGQDSEYAWAPISVLWPSVTLVLPAGYYSLAPGGSGTVSLTNYFPGATIDKDSISIGGIGVTGQPATLVPASGSVTVSFTVPASITTSGVYSICVPEDTSAVIKATSAALAPSYATTNAIVSTPSLSDLTIQLAESHSDPPGHFLGWQVYGSTVKVYLSGYPSSASGISLAVGGVTVSTGIQTDANGAFEGTFVVPALPGSSIWAGKVYLVQSMSAQGFQAEYPAWLAVHTHVTVTGTEPYFTLDGNGYLASGDTVTISGSGFDPLSPVSFGGTATTVGSFAPAMTGPTGSFTTTYTVTSTRLQTNYVYCAEFWTSDWAYVDYGTLFLAYGTPVLTESLELGTAGTLVTFTGTNLVSFPCVTYSVSSPMLASTVVLDSSSGTGSVSSSPPPKAGVYAVVLTGSAPFDTLTSTVYFEVSYSTTPTDGYLVNATDGSSLTVEPGASFTVYAVDFDIGSPPSIALGWTGLWWSFCDSLITSNSEIGGAIFNVTASTSATGTYLIYATQGSYITNLSTSLTVTVSGPLAHAKWVPNSPYVSGLTVTSGTIDNLVVESCGFAPYTKYSVFFGLPGAASGANVGTVVTDQWGSIEWIAGTVSIPAVVTGNYVMGFAPLTTAPVLALAAVLPTTVQTVSVTNNVAWSVDPNAFPGQLVSFNYTSGPLVNQIPGTPVSVDVVLSTGGGSSFFYEQVPVTETYCGGTTYLSGSFVMFNGVPGSSYTVELIPVYSTPATVMMPIGFSFTSISDTYEVFDFNATTPYEFLGANVSIVGPLGTDDDMPYVAAYAGPPTYEFPSPSVQLFAENLTWGGGYTVTGTLEETSGVPVSTFGTESNPVTLTLVNGSGALVVNITTTDIAQIVTRTGATVNITLDQLGATVTSISDGVVDLASSVGTLSMRVALLNASLLVVGKGVVQLATSLGELTVNVSALDPYVESIAQGVVDLQTSVGDLTVNVTALGARAATIENGVVFVKSALGELATNLSGLNATVQGIVNGVADLGTSLGKLTVSLSELNATITGIGNGVVRLQTSLGALTTNLTALSASVKTVEAGVVTIETTAGSINTSLAAMDASIKAINGAVLTLTTDYGLVSATLTSINGTVTTTAKSVDDLVGSVATIQTDVGALQGTVTSVNRTVATIETREGNLTANISSLRTSASSISTTTNSLESLWVALVVLVVITLAIAVLVFAWTRGRSGREPPMPPQGGGPPTQAQ